MTKDSSKLDNVVIAARQNADLRAKGYREQALKLFPWVCGRCTRAYERSNLSELEVHHKNCDHNDNPADGSNWELLCTYCHEEEHTKFMNSTGCPTEDASEDIATHNPFANIKDMLKKK